MATSIAKHFEGLTRWRGGIRRDGGYNAVSDDAQNPQQAYEENLQIIKNIVKDVEVTKGIEHRATFAGVQSAISTFGLKGTGFGLVGLGFAALTPFFPAGTVIGLVGLGLCFTAVAFQCAKAALAHQEKRAEKLRELHEEALKGGETARQLAILAMEEALEERGLKFSKSEKAEFRKELEAVSQNKILKSEFDTKWDKIIDDKDKAHKQEIVNNEKNIKEAAERKERNKDAEAFRDVLASKGFKPRNDEEQAKYLADLQKVKDKGIFHPEKNSTGLKPVEMNEMYNDYQQKIDTQKAIDGVEKSYKQAGIKMTEADRTKLASQAEAYANGSTTAKDFNSSWNKNLSEKVAEKAGPTEGKTSENIQQQMDKKGLFGAVEEKDRAAVKEEFLKDAKNVNKKGLEGVFAKESMSEKEFNTKWNKKLGLDQKGEDAAKAKKAFGEFSFEAVQSKYDEVARKHSNVKEVSVDVGQQITKEDLSKALENVRTLSEKGNDPLFAAAGRTASADLKGKGASEQKSKNSSPLPGMSHEFFEQNQQKNQIPV